MPVSELLAALPVKTVVGAPPSSVSSVTDDSRRVEPGSCFVALPGLRQDARRFVPDAVRRGATLVVTEGEALSTVAVAQVLVPSARESLAHLADTYYGHPSRALLLVGITGTNGKTTTSYLVEALLRGRGLETGVIGTIQYAVGGRAREASQTTPDALELQGLLAEMVASGVGAVSMEVSSHALAQRRVDGIAFDVAIFTNLTQDHLDFHGTMERYAEAKARLFFELLREGGKPGATAVLNADDPVGADWARRLGGRVLTFGLAAGTGLSGFSRGHRSTLSGLTLEAET